MTIDIITYTDMQFAELSEEQLLEVREAQLKKNKLLENLAKNLQKEKERLVKNGIFTSNVWNLLQEKLTEECEAEVTTLREALLFYLRFSSHATTEEEKNSPYVVDYSLSYEDRLTIVKNYYEATYTDPIVRYNEFLADPVARQYLGELYAPLHDVFYVAAHQ